MRNPFRSVGAGYWLAILVTALVALVRFTLKDLLGSEAPLLPFVATVMVVAWYGGLKPGLLATALSAVVSAYLFVPPAYSLRIEQVSNGLHLAIFLVIGITISWLAEALHGARRRAEAKQRELAQESAQRRRAEQSAWASEQRLQLAIEGAGMAMWDMDVKTGRAIWSRTLFELLGYPPNPAGEADYSMWVSRLHPKDRDRVLAALEAAQREQGLYRPEYRICRADDGAERWVSAFGRFLYDERAQAMRFIGVSFDITERQQLSISRQDLDFIVEAANLGLWSNDWPLGQLNWNRQVREHFWLTPEAEVDIERFYAILHPEDREPCQRAADKAVAEHGLFDMTYRTLGPSGQIKWVRAVGRAYYDAEGKPIRFAGITQDVSQQKSMEQALRKSEQRFRVAQELSLFGFTILRSVRNMQGTIIDFEWEYVNPAAERILRRSPDQLLGKRLLRVLPGNKERSELFDRYVQAVETGQPHDIELYYESEGIKGWFRNMTVKLDDGVAISFTDITRQKELEEQLRLQVEQLAEANRRKDEFLAMLAHELRNPLAPIRHAVQILNLTGPKEPVLQQARDMIERQVSHMARLIDDLLDVSRITRGKIELRQERLNLVPLVRQAAEDYRSLLDAAELALILELAEQPLWVDGDPARLSQMVGNLLHNAHKFTPSGGRVSVSVSAEDTQAVVRVADTGIGMEPALLERVFDVFSQADQGLARSRGGLGLGLALVKGLAHLHGGEVSAASAGPGQGAAFTLRLPLQAAPLARTPTEAPATPPPAACRVLVIEDNVDAAESLAMLLTLSGYKVRTAYSGQAGLEAARAFAPQVVLCDIGLPDLDGYAVARELRAEAALDGVYLIALTGYGRAEDQRQAHAAGFDLHLMKPVEYEQLRHALAVLPARG